MDISWKIDGAVIGLLMYGMAMLLIMIMMTYDTWKETKEYQQHASKRR